MPVQTPAATDAMVRKSIVEGIIADLKPGDFLYIHPARREADDALFGRYIKQRIDQTDEYSGPMLLLHVICSYERRMLHGTSLWVPKVRGFFPLRNTLLRHPIERLVRGDDLLYVGKEQIAQGMRKHGNLNYDLASTVMHILEKEPLPFPG